ncbi:hypothetical protein FGO68_gene9766 [Halteria grandinella]|uniref:Uncharacterized protein n=1 Tax=Halteria grandinella TaxID=5974 RepID=A0A8J8NU84_HALGN|nr:hypothetical protein FGO68_gene9766 [Halteria grandinella]
MRFSSSESVGGQRGRSLRKAAANNTEIVVNMASGQTICSTLVIPTSVKARGRKIETRRNIVAIDLPFGPNQAALHLVNVLITNGCAHPISISPTATLVLVNAIIHMPIAVSIMPTTTLALGPFFSMSHTLRGNSNKKASSLKYLRNEYMKRPSFRLLMRLIQTVVSQENSSATEHSPTTAKILKRCQCSTSTLLQSYSSFCYGQAMVSLPLVKQEISLAVSSAGLQLKLLLIQPGSSSSLVASEESCQTFGSLLRSNNWLFLFAYFIKLIIF